MQVTEISAHGLRREYKVVLPAADLASRLEGELVGMKEKVKINGFRPGKVPLSHLKRLYGRSVMGDIVQNAVNEANRKIVEENGLRLALEPKIDLTSDKAEVERAMEAQGDLAFTVALETIPTFDPGTFEDLTLERQVAEISEDEIGRSIDVLANQNRVFTPKEQEERRGGNRRSPQNRFRGPRRGRGLRGRQGRGCRAGARVRQFHSGFRRSARRGEGRRRPKGRGRLSRELHGRHSCRKTCGLRCQG